MLKLAVKTGIRSPVNLPFPPFFLSTGLAEEGLSRMERGGRRPTAEEVIAKLKDDGDFDELRLKIIRKVKENVSPAPIFSFFFLEFWVILDKYLMPLDAYRSYLIYRKNYLCSYDFLLSRDECYLTRKNLQLNQMNTLLLLSLLIRRQY